MVDFNCEGGAILSEGKNSSTFDSNAASSLDQCMIVFKELEQEIKGLSQAYIDKEKASQTIL